MEASKAMEKEGLGFRNQYNISESTLAALPPNTFPLILLTRRNLSSVQFSRLFLSNITANFLLNFVMCSQQLFLQKEKSCSIQLKIGIFPFPTYYLIINEQKAVVKGSQESDGCLSLSGNKIHKFESLF